MNLRLVKNVLKHYSYTQARPLLHRALEDGVYDELVDIRLENNYNPHEMARMVASAAASISHSARKRPKMSQVRCLINVYEEKINVLNTNTKINFWFKYGSF